MVCNSCCRWHGSSRPNRAPLEASPRVAVRTRLIRHCSVPHERAYNARGVIHRGFARPPMLPVIGVNICALRHRAIVFAVAGVRPTNQPPTQSAAVRLIHTQEVRVACISAVDSRRVVAANPARTQSFIFSQIRLDSARVFTAPVPTQSVRFS